MPHINLPEGLPGISGNFAFRPETAKPMRDLAHILLHEPNSLTPGERELIASHVSNLNGCWFCQASHSAAAACHLQNPALLTDLRNYLESPSVSPKLRALLHIAGNVQRGGKNVTAADIAAARHHGATDTEIHDTVLIAAAFCMYNRYVDALATWQPKETQAYEQMGKHLAEVGYRTPSTPAKVADSPVK